MSDMGCHIPGVKRVAAARVRSQSCLDDAIYMKSRKEPCGHALLAYQSELALCLAAQGSQCRESQQVIAQAITKQYDRMTGGRKRSGGIHSKLRSADVSHYESSP